MKDAVEHYVLRQQQIAVDREKNVMITNVSPEDAIRSLILSEEARISESFPSERRLALMELARAMDYVWTRGHLGLTQADERGKIDLMEFGLNKALKLALDSSTKSPLFPLAESTDAARNWADYVLTTCGLLGRCEQLLEICRTGLGELFAEQPNLYRLRYTSSPIGLEVFEREDTYWYQSAIRRFQAKQLQDLQERRATIDDLMSGLVDIWSEKYIRYDAHPEVDEFYVTRGVLYAQGLFGQDSFSGSTPFGGLPFNLYRAVLGLLIGWTLKHIDFCVLLLERYPSLAAHNILTIPQDLDAMVGYIASALEEDEDAVAQVLAVLTLSLENKRVYCAVPGNFVAPALIQCGKDRLIKPVWGCLSHPFQTMLDGLKFYYRGDWDRGVDHRELHFREELCEFISKPSLCALCNQRQVEKQGQTGHRCGRDYHGQEIGHSGVISA